MDVSVLSAAIGRELYRRNGFVFESFGQDDKSVADDGKRLFLEDFKSKTDCNHAVTNGVRFKVRPLRVRTA